LQKSHQALTKSAAQLKTPMPAVRVVPDKLCAGDEVRILALSRSIGGLKQYAPQLQSSGSASSNRLKLPG
jgi:hypothetical protein